MTPDLQPDQRPALWGEHVGVYETAFEPLTNRFAEQAVAALGLARGARCLDVAAGAGGAALMAAQAGAEVLAIDAAPGMVARIKERAAARRLAVDATVMDAQELTLGDASFDAGLSIFGIILCPDPAGALREMARVVRPGGPIALVTWTEPDRYELIARLIAAISDVRGPQPPPRGVPAQLRFRDASTFEDLFASAGLAVDRIRRIEASLEAPSARWLAERLAFAPGLAAMLDAQGADRDAVVERFVAGLERDQGSGAVRLRAVAFLGLGRVTKPKSATDP